MQLQEILKQPEGFTPPDVTVKIEKVFPYKSGEGENGPWSFQDLQVEGGKIKLKGLPEFPETRVGQSVTIKANQSKQHGLTGLKVAHEQYQNKTYDKLVITSSAKWDWATINENPAGSSNGNGHVAQTNGNGSSSHDSTEYIDHLIRCAELAGVVTGQLGLQDAQAIQACFATICIDSKNRNILLPKASFVEQVEQEEAPQDDPFYEDVPF